MRYTRETLVTCERWTSYNERIGIPILRTVQIEPQNVHKIGNQRGPLCAVCTYTHTHTHRDMH